MNKPVKIILFIVLSAIILIVGGFSVLLGIINYRNKTYWKYSEPKGEIETKYTALGSYDVSYAEFNADGKVWENMKSGIRLKCKRKLHTRLL